MAKKNTSNAEPMEYVRTTSPNLSRERARLAREAEALTRTELDSRAAELGMDTSVAPSKEEAVKAVREAAK